jgi:hypothetical protein
MKTYKITLEETFCFGTFAKEANLSDEQIESMQRDIKTKRIVHSQFKDNIHSDWRVIKIEQIKN